MNRRPRLLRRGARRAAALLQATLVAVGVSLACFALMQLAVVEADRSARSSSTEQSRIAAYAALDEFYGRLIASPNYVDAVSGTAAFVAHPAVGANRWAYLDGVTPRACTLASGAQDYSKSCYHLEVSTADTDNSGLGSGSSARRIIVVEATVRYHCNAGRATACDFTRLQMRARERSFLDAAWFTDRETTDPMLPGAYYETGAASTLGTRAWAQVNCAAPRVSADSQPTENATLGRRNAACVDPSYTGRDLLDGLVFTNDTHTWSCNRPSFSGTLATTGNRTYVSSRFMPQSPLLGCADPSTSAGRPIFAQGAQGQRTNQVPMEMPSVANATTYYSNIAASAHRYTGSAVAITLNGKTMTVSGSSTGTSGTLNIPSGSAVFVNGNVSLRGVLEGALTIYATGNVTIDNNICYAAVNSTVCAPSPASTQAILGLISGQFILIQPNPDPASVPVGRVLDRRVDAVLFSQSNTVYTVGWNTPNDWYRGLQDGTATGSIPDLNLFGAVGTKYRTVFGGFNGIDGEILAGYAKNLTYDQRLSDTRPPYFITPVNAVWQRLGVAEVASGTAGLPGNCVSFCP